MNQIAQLKNARHVKLLSSPVTWSIIFGHSQFTATLFQQSARSVHQQSIITFQIFECTHSIA